MFRDAVREVICKDYLSALEDLTFNSKHYIKMLTQLAKENLYFAKDIVGIVEAHIVKAPAAEKLPVMFLVDSIVKNLKGDYLAEFTKNISISFVLVFEKVDCDTRKTLRRLRNTWDGIFPLETLYALDMRVRCIDPHWPVKSVQFHRMDSSSPINKNLQQPLELTEVNKSHRGDELESEDTRFKPGPFRKKRLCSGSPAPFMPLSKRKDSRAADRRPGGVPPSSSVKCRNGKRGAKGHFPLPANVIDETPIPTGNRSDTQSVARFRPREGTKHKNLKLLEEDRSHITESLSRRWMGFEGESAADNKKGTFSEAPALPLPLSEWKDERLPEGSPEFILSCLPNSWDGRHAKDFSQLANVADQESSPSENGSDYPGPERALDSGACALTTRTYRSGREGFGNQEQCGESQSRVTLGSCLTKLASPLCLPCPGRLHSLGGPQDPLIQSPTMLIAPWRQDRITHCGPLRMPCTPQPSHIMQMPANMLGDASQSFCVQQSRLHGENFNRLSVAGPTTISNSPPTPLVSRFYRPGALVPSTGYMNSPLPAATVLQGMSPRPRFELAWPAAPPFGQSQRLIAPAQNPAPANQQGLQIESLARYSAKTNVNSLVTRLISSGLIKPAMAAPAIAAKTMPFSEKQEKDKVQKVPDLTGFIKEHMKQRYEGVISELHAGQQCSSCSERFRSSGAQTYRDHLDWHYRQNRHRRHSRAWGTAHRGWYCPRQSCEICREVFDLTWEDDREQWCLKNAIRSYGKTYHPSCYEDYRKTL